MIKGHKIEKMLLNKLPFDISFSQKYSKSCSRKYLSIFDVLHVSSLLYIQAWYYMWENFQDYSWIQDFEAELERL